MRRAVLRADELMNRYAGKGGKRFRKQQTGRALAFVKFASGRGVKSLDQVGKKHVAAYLQHLRHQGMAPRTIYAHWRAICALFALLGKPEPPFK